MKWRLIFNCSLSTTATVGRRRAVLRVSQWAKELFHVAYLSSSPAVSTVRSLHRAFYIPSQHLGLQLSWHSRGTYREIPISSRFCQEGTVQKLPLTLYRLPGVNHHGCCAGVYGGSSSGCLVKFRFLVYNSLFAEGIASPSRLLGGSRIGNIWTIYFMSCSRR